LGKVVGFDEDKDVAVLQIDVGDKQVRLSSVLFGKQLFSFKSAHV
jgi:S1-C subfamily serine protease